MPDGSFNKGRSRAAHGRWSETDVTGRQPTSVGEGSARPPSSAPDECRRREAGRLPLPAVSLCVAALRLSGFGTAPEETPRRSVRRAGQARRSHPSPPSTEVRSRRRVGRVKAAKPDGVSRRRSSRRRRHRREITSVDVRVKGRKYSRAMSARAPGESPAARSAVPGAPPGHGARIAPR